jgi:hypothetical protein
MRAKGENMLKITSADETSAEMHWVIEGRLEGPWVRDLETAVSGAATIPGCTYIDISAVTFVDARGMKLLHKLMTQGVVLQPVSPFVQDVLNMKP